MSILVSQEDFGEAPKSARDARALPRSGWPAPKTTTSYLLLLLLLLVLMLVLVTVIDYRSGMHA